MGDHSSIANLDLDEENKIRISALLDAQITPRENWSNQVSPWEYNPIAKKGKSKRQSFDATAGKFSRGLISDGKKKSVVSQTPRDKRKSSRKSFKYYPEIGTYIREYREVTKRIALDYKNCSCHGGYSVKDVEKVYETLPNIKKRETKRSRKPASKPKSSSVAESYDKVKDEGEESSAERIPSSGDSATLVTKQPKQAEDYSFQEGRRSSKQGCKDGLQEFVNHSLGRDFFMSHQYLNKKGSSCPVVKITLPETHDVRRVSRCGSESPQKVFVNDSPNFHQPAMAASVQTFRDFDDSPSTLDTSADAISPSSSYYKALDENKSSRKLSTLSAKVRDFRPFSRNGLATRVSKVVREKHRRRALLDPDKLESDCTKQEIPWEVLRYLGYNPSMRKYLHNIYSPVERNQSKSPLVLSSKKCFDVSIRSEGHKIVSKQPCENCHAFLPDARSRKLTARDFFDNGKPFETQRNKPSNTFVENYLKVSRQERPKIAILPKLDTVVKPKVMKKFIVK